MNRTLVAAALVAISVGGCRSSAHLISLAPEAPITIDAQLEEWSGTLSTFEDDKVMVGVRDDGESAYVAVRISDQETMRQVMMMGLQVWIDPDGGRDEVFAIQYPLGLIAYNRGRAGQMPLPSGRSDPGEIARMFGETLTELDVLAEGSAPRRMSNGQSPDFTVAARREYGALVYELSFPLSGSSDLGLPAIEGDFALSVQTGSLGRPGGGQRDGSSVGRGGQRGGMSGRGGRGQSRRPAGVRNAPPQPLELWIQVENKGANQAS